MKIWRQSEGKKEQVLEGESGLGEIKQGYDKKRKEKWIRREGGT